jgi:hypothetical protein
MTGPGTNGTDEIRTVRRSGAALVSAPNGCRRRQPYRFNAAKAAATPSSQARSTSCTASTGTAPSRRHGAVAPRGADTRTAGAPRLTCRQPSRAPVGLGEPMTQATVFVLMHEGGWAGQAERMKGRPSRGRPISVDLPAPSWIPRERMIGRLPKEHARSPKSARRWRLHRRQ